jgi:NADPH:quinone reductase-like Zn-dependent oxidoreductase
MTGAAHGNAPLPEHIEASVVYLNAPRELEIRQEGLATKSLGAGEILCETLLTAISPGTELGAYTGLPALRAGVAYPRLQGYCNVARVLALGPGVSGIRCDDRVLSFASHRSHYVMAAADVLLVLSKDAKADEVVCTYLYHLGYDAVLRANVRAGNRVLVVGLGVLGLTSVAMAGVAGARVFAVSNHSIPQRIALESGASAVFRRSDLQGLRTALTEGLADVVIVTSNSWEDWLICLEMAAMRGVIACLGFPGRGQAPAALNPLDSRFFYAKQLQIMAVGMSPEKPDARGFLRFNERDNMKFLAHLIEIERLRPRMLVSGTYAAGDIDRAYCDLLRRKDSAITYLLRWH